MQSLRHTIDGLLKWVGSRDLVLMLAILAVVAGIWFFAELAGRARADAAPDFDRRLIRAMRRADDAAVPIGPPWVAEAGRDITALGGYTVLTLLTAIVAGYLSILGKRHAGWLLVGATVSGLIVMHLLKGLVHRPRPDIVPHLSFVDSTSFPSGHAMLSAVVYLTLGAMLARLVDSRPLKTYVLSIAILLAFLVGVSRVFLGVHYPTDVLAGWTAGLVWAILCWLLTRSLQRRGAVETDVRPPH